MNAMNDMFDQGGVGEIQESGASSSEDFWMFFSFAMILLVFVLMNYVNYLNSLVVKVEREKAAQEEVMDSAAEEAPVVEEQELHVIVGIHAAQETPIYTIGQEETPLDTVQLQAELVSKFADLTEQPLKLFVHAPGNARYKWVFDATYAATEAAETQGLVDFNIHLVYEETE